jgi:hypothetical protein
VIIKLHIDRLVLEGDAFARMDRARLGAAVQAQLAALLREGTNVDALSARHGAAALRGESVTRVPAETPAAQWGHHIAGAVHGALTSTPRGESRGAGPRGGTT